ncbi:MAG: hypothetical protein Q8M24_13635 [Pseudolabrys sp.]|nr:hypothetical protein [Pseudolabrys sp.]MDP2296485.1 hypothetical protein [Pseudolabrys sp.]
MGTALENSTDIMIGGAPTVETMRRFPAGFGFAVEKTTTGAAALFY